MTGIVLHNGTYGFCKLVQVNLCWTSIKNGRRQAKNENGWFASGKLQTINNSYRLIILRSYLMCSILKLNLFERISSRRRYKLVICQISYRYRKKGRNGWFASWKLQSINNSYRSIILRNYLLCSKCIMYVNCTYWTKWTFFSKLLLLILELTGAEIKSLPEETRLYESVGRMFMLSSRSEITGK